MKTFELPARFAGLLIRQAMGYVASGEPIDSDIGEMYQDVLNYFMDEEPDFYSKTMNMFKKKFGSDETFDLSLIPKP